MYARIVRFTDVDPSKLDEIVAQIEGDDGPPDGIRSTGLKLYHDAEQGTMLFVGTFASEEDLRAADEILNQMDPSETPGTRASVDRCRLRVERDS